MIAAEMDRFDRRCASVDHTVTQTAAFRVNASVIMHRHEWMMDHSCSTRGMGAVRDEASGAGRPVERGSIHPRPAPNCFFFLIAGRHQLPRLICKSHAEPRERQPEASQKSTPPLASGGS